MPSLHRYIHGYNYRNVNVYMCAYIHDILIYSLIFKHGIWLQGYMKTALTTVEKHFEPSSKGR